MGEIRVKQTSCIRCHACVKDCVAKIIGVDEEGFPQVKPTDARRCLGCQHCLAVCPTGALSFAGIRGTDAMPAGALPDAASMLNLLRQRRSVRQYADENLPLELLRELESALPWSPTGCHDHRLHFAIVEDKSEMAFFRSELVRVLRRLRSLGIVRLFFPRYRGAVDAVIDGADLVFRGAPHMIVASVSRHAPCREADPWIALSQFEVLAQSLGVGTCWCGLGERAIRRIGSLRRRLGIPPGYQVGAAMLFGRSLVSYPRGTVPKPFPISHVGRNN